MKTFALISLLFTALCCNLQAQLSSCMGLASEGSDPPTSLNATCSSTNPTSCTLTWNTVHNANSWVVLGLNDGTGADSRQYSNLSFTTSHSVTVDHLLPNTSYNIYAASCSSGSGFCSQTSPDWSSYPVALTGTTPSGVAFCHLQTPLPTGSTFSFQIWEYGQTHIYQNHSTSEVPNELWVELQLPVTSGTIPSGPITYLTSATIDGQACTFDPDTDVCGTTNLGVELMAASDFNPNTSNHYDYFYSTTKNWYYLSGYTTQAFLRIYPSSSTALPATGAHTVTYTLQVYSSGSSVASASTSYNFNMVSPASFSANPPSTFPAIPGYSTYVQQMAYLGTGWCSKLTATTNNPGNGSIISEQGFGNFYNDDFGAIESGYGQWNYDGNRVYKQIRDLMGASYTGIWSGSTTYGTTASNIAIRPITSINPGNYTFVALKSGTSGTTMPTWNTGPNQTPGGQISDGTVTWINAGNSAYWNSCSLKVGEALRNWSLGTQLTIASEWNEFPFGMLMDYFRTGDALNEGGGQVTGLNEQAIGYGATPPNGGYFNAQAKYYKTPDTGGMRARSYSANNFIAEWLLTCSKTTGCVEDPPSTGKYLEKAIDTILGHLDSAVNYQANQTALNATNALNGTSNIAWNFSNHPFTMGIEMDTAISYYNAQIVAGQTPDPRIPLQVRSALDWLWNYWNMNGTNYSFAYQFWDLPKLASYNGNMFTALNDTVAPAYAWMWAICGSSCTLPDGVTTYQQAADLAFQHEFDSCGTNCLAGQFDSAKQFNQAYELSFDGVYWRTGAYPYSTMTTLATENSNTGAYPDTALPYNATITVGGTGCGGICETPAPVVTVVGNTVTITWDTFEKTVVADSQVLYGTSCSSPTSTDTGHDSETQVSGTNRWQHVYTLSSVASGMYCYAVATTDYSGNVAQSSYSSTFPSQFAFTVP